MNAGPRTSAAGAIVAVATVVAQMPAFPVIPAWGWDSHHICLLAIGLATAFGLHAAADGKPKE